MTFTNSLQAFIIILISLELRHQNTESDIKLNKKKLQNESCFMELVSCMGSIKVNRGLK